MGGVYDQKIETHCYVDGSKLVGGGVRGMQRRHPDSVGMGRSVDRLTRASFLQAYEGDSWATTCECVVCDLLPGIPAGG